MTQSTVSFDDTQSLFDFIHHLQAPSFALLYQY